MHLIGLERVVFRNSGAATEFVITGSGCSETSAALLPDVIGVRIVTLRTPNLADAFMD